MRPVWTTLEFRMVLYTDMETIGTDFYSFYKSMIWRSTDNIHTMRNKLFTEVIVEFVSVAMSFLDLICSIALL